MKRIGIVGTRSRDTESDYILVRDKFFEVYEPGDTIVSGGCKQGGDRFAEILNTWYQIPILIHRPESIPPGSPRWMYTQANYARNTLIAQDSDVLIACVSDDHLGGTGDTLKKFRKFYLDGVIYLV